jgi:ATP-dependent DNA helicase RecQ
LHILDSELINYLRQATGIPDAEFRDGQLESIRKLLDNQRLIVVQRTGWGKSIVYFIATKMLRSRQRGITLLISPLLSLMRNQLTAAYRVGLKAASINSTNPHEWDEIIADILADKIDILLISPERLANQDFRNRVMNSIAKRIGLFVVDEVHCISDWGHDFRPDYRRIVNIINLLPPNTPVIGTTATANDRVVNDILQTLGSISIERGPLTRESISLQNLRIKSKAERYAWLAGHLHELPGTGIIYTLTKSDAEKLTQFLNNQGHQVEVYHASVESDSIFLSEDKDRREELEQMLINNEIKALVATVALGMGFDKPDLGFVVHFQRPGSVVHYYQQVGRAGRAVDRALGLLMTGEEDGDIIEYFIEKAMPPQIFVKELITQLSDAEHGLSTRELQVRMNSKSRMIEAAIKFLQTESPSPIVKDGARWKRSPVHYEFDVERVEQIKKTRRSEQAQMQAYMETDSCLMEYLGRALDDPNPKRCGRCANCLGKALVDEQIAPELVNKAGIYLKNSYLNIDVRKLWPTSYCFQSYPELCLSSSIPKGLRPAGIMALSSWRDAGWGELVYKGKYVDGRFSQELVQGMREMIASWNPDPLPVWLTCTPSRRHPELMPEFARRLADVLGIPFVPCIEKIRDNGEQKLMQNSYHQCSNLDGVFAINKDLILNGPVLLVDDAVDSRWTITLLSALLLQSGIPAVHAAVLTRTST